MLILGALDLMLLLSGSRILIDERYIPAREAVIGSSIWAPAEEASWSCTYFTGRSRTYESLPATSFDECPFVWDAG